MFNYANPNSMITWACNKYGQVPTIGLCHGVQHGHHQLAEVFGLAKNEVDIICAGINHQTWYIQIKHQGKDLTPYLLEAFENIQFIVKLKKFELICFGVLVTIVLNQTVI